MTPRKTRRSRRWLWLLLLVPLLAIGGFLIWAMQAAQPMTEALAALQSDAQVKVDTSRWLLFEPVAGGETTGFVFYPGGKVDPRAYAPAAHQLAADGFLTVIVPVPLNLAFFGADKAGEVIAAYPQVTHWAVGGHSLGGVVAAQYAGAHTDKVQGLALWASYPADSDNLSASSLKVASISGSNDGLSTPAKIEASRTLLPTSTEWVVIQGGNHGQFGYYGPQDGDNAATISREDQQQQVVAATEKLLQSLSAP